MTEDKGSATERVLQIEGLRVRYGRQEVVTGVDLELRSGEALALIGRNGAGKSSLVRCVLGQQKPASGRIQLFGRDAWKNRATLMQRVGVVPEEADAPPTMSPRQLARFCRGLYGSWDQAGFERHLERFEIPQTTAFGSLSRGQKTQVMLALALAPRPELLVLDDPTLGLDAVARRAVFEELVGELADRGTTVLLTSHDLPGIESLATRIAVLAGGRLAANEDLDELKARFRWVTADSAEDLVELAPLEDVAHGRRRRVLVSRWRDAFRGPGGAAAETAAASLEEIVVALSSRRSQKERNGR